MRKVQVKVLRDGTPAASRQLKRLALRGDGPEDVLPAVQGILEDVRRSGDRALLRYTRKFDGVRLRADQIEIPRSELRRAEARLDSSVTEALRAANQRIRTFHEKQVETGYMVRERGVRTGMRVLPLRRAGVYVPGGRAAYPSSVLMNVVPAIVAGVDEVVVVTPPGKDGVRDDVLAAASIAGAHRVLQIGGAQAVAALAYGTATVPRVDKIVGPGNIYVATAKRLVFGSVDIDMVAGPSEVLVLADGSADPEFVAADMLAQAEHDPLAASVCVCTSARVAEEVTRELARQTPELERSEIAAESIRRYGTVLLVSGMRRAAALADEIAPEHLELCVRDPEKWVDRIRNAGAVFLGHYSTEALGDYAAGPNHVLPTGGAARFSSPLGVYDFVKRTSIIDVDAAGLRRLAPTVVTLARSEGLGAHAASVTRRVERTTQTGNTAPATKAARSARRTPKNPIRS